MSEPNRSTARRCDCCGRPTASRWCAACSECIPSPIDVTELDGLDGGTIKRGPGCPVLLAAARSSTREDIFTLPSFLSRGNVFGVDTAPDAAPAPDVPNEPGSMLAGALLGASPRTLRKGISFLEQILSRHRGGEPEPSKAIAGKKPRKRKPKDGGAR